LCSVRVCTDAYKLLLICVYMPNESNDAEQSEHSSVLADIIDIIVIANQLSYYSRF